MFAEKIALSNTEDVQLVWLHGWGLDHTSLKPLALTLQAVGESYLVDLPGFGETPLPKKAWDTEDYADEVAKFIRGLPKRKTFVIGHSFGGRVAVRLAYKYPKLVQGIVLLGGAGLQKKRSLLFRGYQFLVKRYGKLVKKVFPFLKHISLSSADYKNSSGLKRDIFVKTISEDLTPLAGQIMRPALLVYGEKDTETPPEFGQRYHQLLKNSTLYIVPGQDHWSILRLQQTAAYINNFISENLV